MRNRLKLCLVAICLLAMIGCQKVNSNSSKKALLIVSFGTSFVENRIAGIDSTEKVIEEAFPEYDRFSAFTSQIIIDVYRDRDNVKFLNVSEAIEKIYREGYGEVLVVPTLIINGDEYDEMMEALDPFKDKFSKLTISRALLTSVDDYENVVNSMVVDLPVNQRDTAVILLGHGTHHHANSAYPAMDYVLKHMGYKDIYVGTVEGSPMYDAVSKDLKNKGYKKVFLMPLMLVAGDHTYNDMAGDEVDSWKVMLKTEGYEVDYKIKGMGEFQAIREMFVDHANIALQEEEH